MQFDDAPLPGQIGETARVGTMHAGARLTAQRAHAAAPVCMGDQNDAIRRRQKPINRQTGRDQRQQRDWEQDGSRKESNLSLMCPFPPPLSPARTENAEEPQSGPRIGTHGKGFEVGSRSRGRTRTYHELKRLLIRPEEIMHDTREDEMFVIAKAGRPLRCGRAIYFRRPEFVRRAGSNRFVNLPAHSRGAAPAEAAQREKSDA